MSGTQLPVLFWRRSLRQWRREFRLLGYARENIRSIGPDLIEIIDTAAVVDAQCFRGDSPSNRLRIDEITGFGLASGGAPNIELQIAGVLLGINSAIRSVSNIFPASSSLLNSVATQARPTDRVCSNHIFTLTDRPDELQPHGIATGLVFVAIKQDGNAMQVSITLVQLYNLPNRSDLADRARLRMVTLKTTPGRTTFYERNFLSRGTDSPADTYYLLVQELFTLYSGQQNRALTAVEIIREFDSQIAEIMQSDMSRGRLMAQTYNAMCQLPRGLAAQHRMRADRAGELLNQLAIDFINNLRDGVASGDIREELDLDAIILRQVRSLRNQYIRSAQFELRNVDGISDLWIEHLFDAFWRDCVVEDYGILLRIAIAQADEPEFQLAQPLDWGNFYDQDDDSDEFRLEAPPRLADLVEEDAQTDEIGSSTPSRKLNFLATNANRNPPIMITITVEDKTSGHRFFGIGGTKAYRVIGRGASTRFGGTLMLQRNTNYEFRIVDNKRHPFFIGTNRVGGSTEGKILPTDNAISNGVFQFNTSELGLGKFYGVCATHEYMGFRIKIE